MCSLFGLIDFRESLTQRQRNKISLLRKKNELPQTNIETDSYIAVQLLEKQKALNLDSLKEMAKKVEGSFCFTVLDRNGRISIPHT